MSSLLALILALQPNINPYLGLILAQDISEYCNHPRLAVIIAYHESRFNPKAVHVNKNGTRDVGLFQVNSIHGTPTTVRQDVRMGCKVLNNFGANDYSKFHSKTPSKRAAYEKKIESIFFSLTLDPRFIKLSKEGAKK